MTNKEALDEVRRLSTILRKNAMIRAGAMKDNTKKPAVEMVEKYGQFRQDKPRKVLDRRFQERYKTRLMALFSDDMEKIYELFADQDVIARLLVDDPEYRNKRADNIKVLQDLITNLVMELPTGLIRRRLPGVNRRCEAILESRGEVSLANEVLWSAVYYTLYSPFKYTDDIYVIFKYFLRYIEGIYGGFIFNDPDPESEEIFYQTVYYNKLEDRLSIMTEFAIILCGGDDEVATYLENRRVHRKNGDLTLEDAASFYAKAANCWINPVFNAWVKTQPEIKLTPITETVCFNNPDAYQFILAVTFIGYILNSNIYNWTLNNMLGIKLA